MSSCTLTCTYGVRRTRKKWRKDLVVDNLVLDVHHCLDEMRGMKMNECVRLCG